MQDIIQMISSVGFPIACACACGYYVKYITDKNREQVANLNQKHRDEISEIVKAINNNTVALTKLVEKLEGGMISD